MHKPILVGAIIVGCVGMVVVGYFILFASSGSPFKQGLQNPPVWHIGILADSTTYTSIAYGFEAKMAELGYIEGRSVVYDLEYGNTDKGKEQQIVQKFVADKDNLVFAFPTGAAIIAKQTAASSGIPVLFAWSTVEGANLIDNMNIPGGNITGVRFPGASLATDRLKLLHQLIPKAKNVLAPYLSGYSVDVDALQYLRPEAATLGITLVEMPVNTIDDLKAGLASSSASVAGADAVFMMPDSFTQAPEQWALIKAFAAEHNVPIAGMAASEADDGALFTYIPDTTDVGKQAAILADEIFRGVAAGTIPVVTPQSYLRVNAGVAKKLDITISPDILAGANEVIQ